MASLPFSNKKFQFILIVNLIKFKKYLLSKIMKILFIAPLPMPITGQSVACKLLFDELSKVNDINCINFNKSIAKDGGTLLRVAQLAKLAVKTIFLMPRADVIYYNPSESLGGGLKDLCFYLILFFKLNKTVLHLHGGAGMRILLSDAHPIIFRLNKFFLKRVGAVVVLGDRLKSIYKGIVSDERLYAVVNYAGDDYYLDRESLDIKFKQSMKINMLFLSNLLPQKGHEELLAALALIPKELLSMLKVDFAGGFESSKAQSLFSNAVRAVSGAEITVHGVVQGELKKKLLSGAHLFCLPTYYPYEGQPISILEAYASGCAVMTTDHSGIFDTFTPGVNGIEVQPRSPESIAQAIQRALSQPQALKAYARTNLEHARQKYRASTHVEALEKIIYSVANSSTIR